MDGRPALVLAATLLAGGASYPPTAESADPRVAGLLGAVSEERLAQIVKTLVSFGTRNTLSSTDSATRGIGAARQWILEEMASSSPRLQVSFDAYEVLKQGERITRDVQLRNVMAVLPGRSPRRFYISGHYDSLARSAPAGATPSASGGFDWSAADVPAPGADDDGSGTALTMELARVFAASRIEFDATLVFIAFAGEEQGLVGAKLHAKKAAEEKVPIEAVFNSDIVGGTVGGNGRVDSTRLRVFSEGPEDSSSRQVARAIRRQAALYIPSQEVRLIARPDRFGRGGDHTPFNQYGFAAVRFTESCENYAHQHTVEDTPDGVTPAYLARNTRVVAAALGTLALAPPAPSVVDERGRPLAGRGKSGYDAELRWNASPGAVGYRVFWREAWAPDWTHEATVGNVTQLVLPDVSIDDYVFGVAAVGPEGNESLVSAYINPPRPEVEIRTK